MENSAVRMIAKMILANKMEVLLVRQYYDGNSDRFYLRNVLTGNLQEIMISAKYVEEKYTHYFFDDVNIDFTQVYQVLDAYGLSETLQYTPLPKSCPS